MDWYFTWQDPVAIGLAALFIWFAFWLSRHVEQTGRCATCPSKRQIATRAPVSVVAPTVVRLDQLSLSRHKKVSDTPS